MDYREELFKALTAGIEGTMRDKHIDALVEVCRAARKEGYNAGIKDGNISDGTLEEKVKEAYENGANDIWEFVRELGTAPSGTSMKIFGMSYNTVLGDLKALSAMAKYKEYKEKQKAQVFKVGDRVEIMEGHDITGLSAERVGTIGEVMNVDCDGDCLVKAYGEHSVPYYYSADALKLANAEILIGDEVYKLDKDYHGVVTAVWEDCGVVKTERLTQSGKLACDDAKDLHRTSRRFPEIANVLKQMQED